MIESKEQLVIELLNKDFLIDLSIDPMSSPVLARLIEEVKNESESTVYSYDRAHNRHNR